MSNSSMTELSIGKMGLQGHSPQGMDDAPAAQSSRRVQGTPPLWRNTTVFLDSYGQYRAFSVGLDGYIWSYTTHQDSATSGRLKSTGLAADQFAVVRAADQGTLLVAVSGSLVCLATQEAGVDAPWSPPMQVPEPPWLDGHEVVKISALVRQGQVLVCVVTHCDPPEQPGQPRFWVARWTGQALVFNPKPIVMHNDNPLSSNFRFTEVQH